MHVSHPLSPGEVAPHQRCDLFIRRWQMRLWRWHKKRRLALSNCLICLLGEPLPPLRPTPPPPHTHTLPYCHLPHFFPGAPTGEELVYVKLRGNSGALLSITAGVDTTHTITISSSSASSSSPFIPQKHHRSKSSGGQKVSLKGNRDARSWRTEGGEEEERVRKRSDGGRGSQILSLCCS